MKTAEPKIASSTIQRKAAGSFFNKAGGSVLSCANEIETPFFTSYKATSAVQAKLNIGQPSDKYEQDADAVADRVVQKVNEPVITQPKEMGNGSLVTDSVQSKANEKEEDNLQKKEEETKEEEPNPELQRRPVPEALPETGSLADNNIIGGIHLKCAACEEEKETVQKKEAPEEEQATRLPVQAKLTIGEPDDPYEKEADAVADQVVQKLNEPGIVQTKPVAFEAPVTHFVQAKSNIVPQETVPEKEEENIEESPLELQRKSVMEALPEPPEAPDDNNANQPYASLRLKCDAPASMGIVPTIQAKPVFESDAEPVVQRRCRECDEGDQIFLKPTNRLQLAVTDTPKADGSRESILAAARTMLGRIEAKNNDGTGRRVGAEYLLEIFHLAAPGVWDDSIIETAGAPLPSWCGIFSVWAHKKAGKDIGTWQMGKGVSAFGTLQPTTNPMPGDIGYIHKDYQHHALVVKVEGDTVHTIDGNSGAFSEVKENIKPKSKYNLFLTAFSSSGSVQRRAENNIQKAGEASTANTASSSIESKLSSSKGSGVSLPEPVRNNMESSIGADFSNVKIHTDGSAVQMSKELNAQAFTHGSDIYFNSGKYDTGSKDGQHLLAHELTHTVQQGGVRTKPIESGNNKNSTADVIQTSAAPASAHIQKTGEKEDGVAISAAKEGMWSLIKAASPEIHDILRYKGFTNWAKEKISSFVTTTVDTLSAPIKVGAAVIQEVKEKFSEFATWMASAAERIKQGDCTPFIEASDYINNILEGITGPLLEKLKAFLKPIKEFIDTLWNDVGKPIWDFVTKVFGAIWDDIKWVADKVWNYIKKVVKVYADIWHWFATAVGFEGDDPNSFWEQIKKKVAELWDTIKKKLEPYKTQLLVVAGIILLLSPAGPFIIAAAAITGIMYAASKIRHYLQDKEAIIKERGFIKGVLIPALFEALNTAGDFLKSKATAISGGLKKAVAALNGISKDIGETALSFINGIVDWLTEKFQLMSTWAESQLEKLVLKLQDIFARIVKFLQPVMDILSRVGEAIADYYKLPFLILNELFFKIPKCVRDKIIAFLTKHVFKHIPILKEIKDVEAAWAKMQAKVIQIIDMVFVHGRLLDALWEIFNLLLDALKFPKELAAKVYNKAFDVFDTIIEKPKVFFVNMLTTVKLGLSGFFDRKWTHLKNGFSNWLLGATAGTGFYVPKAFNFEEIFKMLGSIFNIGMEKVYKSIAKKRDQETANKVRTWVNRISKGAAMAWKWLKALHENSLDDTIEMIREKGSELVDAAIDGIIDWIVTKVIEKVSAKIITMLDPTGIMPVINSIIAFYNAVETAIEKAREILEFVDGVLDNVSELMAGAFDKAAMRLEDNLEKAIPLFLEFLANQLSMSNLGKKLHEMAKKAEAWIDEKIDWLVDKALAAGDWLVETGKKAIETIKGWLGLRKEFTEDGEPHAIYFSGTEESPEIILESNPKPIKNFLQKFIDNTKASKEKKDAANTAKAYIVNTIEPLVRQISKEKDDAKKVELQNKLLLSFTELSDKIRVLLGKTQLSKILEEEKYNLEGMTGTYGSMPKPKGDQFTADHQPQAAVIKYAANMEIFKNNEEIQKRAAGSHADGAFAINLQKIRHEEGTTYGNKGKVTLAAFVNKANAIDGSTRPDKTKRKEIVELMKADLESDVSRMRKVAKDEKNYSDLDKLGLEEEEQKLLQETIQSQISAGEDIIASQDMDSMKK
jgi:Domain of unknown function (DUF4157)